MTTPGFHPKDTTLILTFRDVGSKACFSGDTGPGWYIRATQNEGYQDLVRTRRITPTQAEAIAASIDEIVGGEQCFDGVRALNEHLKSGLEHEIELLDQQIARRDERIRMIREIDR